MSALFARRVLKQIAAPMLKMRPICATSHAWPQCALFLLKGHGRVHEAPLVRGESGSLRPQDCLRCMWLAGP